MWLSCQGYERDGDICVEHVPAVNQMAIRQEHPITVLHAVGMQLVMPCRGVSLV